jgi:hypothetical protein
MMIDGLIVVSQTAILMAAREPAGESRGGNARGEQQPRQVSVVLEYREQRDRVERDRA